MVINSRVQHIQDGEPVELSDGMVSAARAFVVAKAQRRSGRGAPNYADLLAIIRGGAATEIQFKSELRRFSPNLSVLSDDELHALFAYWHEWAKTDVSDKRKLLIQLGHTSRTIEKVLSCLEQSRSETQDQIEELATLLAHDHAREAKALFPEAGDGEIDDFLKALEQLVAVPKMVEAFDEY